MKFQHKNIQIYIKWKHLYKEVPFKHPKLERVFTNRVPYGTNCDIFFSDTETNEGIVVFTGTALLHPKDNFNKAIGRKISLTRAIEDLPKTVRTQIWEKYHKLWPTK